MRAATAYGDRAAVIFDDQVLSYRQLAERARRTAAYLLGSGLKPGDRVAFWLPNSPEFIDLAFGIAMAGMIQVPLSTRLKSVDLRHALVKSRAQALFLTGDFLEIDFFGVLESAGPDTCLDLMQIVNIGSEGSGRIRSMDDWRARITPVPDLPAVESDAPAMISFTSGTTSSPKGAVLGHGSLIHTARSVGERMAISPGDRAVSAMPFYHNGGFVPTLMSSLMFGCPLHSQPRFDPEYVLSIIARERCTLLSGVGTIFTMMIDSPEFSRTDLSSLRAVRITGPVDERRAVVERFGNVALFSLWGMTETTSTATLSCPGDSTREQVDTNGKPLPGKHFRIIGPGGEDLGPDDQGEVWVGGPFLMQGYYGDPEGTAAVMTPDNWLRTGDLGYLDRNGNLVLVGRIKDMYRTGGNNVACAEVEAFLRSHPAVVNAAILGVPDHRMGEVGLAFVELRPGLGATAHELQDYCRRHLANFKVPRTVIFRDSLPMNSSGRVQKFKLQAEALAVLPQVRNCV